MKIRNAECGTAVIGPLSLVICSGNKHGGKGGNREPARGGQAGGRGTGGEGPAKGGQAEGTAKTADGGRRPGIGIRDSGMANGRKTSPPHRAGVNHRPPESRSAGGNGRELTVRPNGAADCGHG